MRMYIVTIYDKRAQTYGGPMVFPTLGVAERAFADNVNDPQSMINKHPEDYMMYLIGTFDTEKAIIIQADAHQLLSEAHQLLQVRN